MTRSERLVKQYAYFIVHGKDAEGTKLDVGAALRRANHKFERRFRAMETMADADGRALAGQSLDAQDAYWNRAKQFEREP